MAPKKYGLGRKFCEDGRDRGYMLQRLLGPVGAPLPTRKTWAINGKALNQGNTGTCVGNGWANFLRCAPIRTGQDENDAWAIYDAAILLDEWPENDVDPDRQMGTSVRAGAKAVTDKGRLQSYAWAFDLQPAVEYVLTQGPVVLGTNWYTSFFKPDAEGIITIKPRDRVEGGHCYLWRGVDTKRALATCSNSWGDDWGKSGEFYIPFRDLERLIHEDGEACTAIEKKLKAK